MKNESFVIGVDYGTDSVRSIIVNAHNGEEIANAVVEYPRWQKRNQWINNFTLIREL